MHDLIIVGAGPAGMTAAVYAARKKITTLLLSKDVGGQMTWTLGIENYMGYQFIEGPELIQKFNDQVRQVPIEQRIGETAVSLARVEDGYGSAISPAIELYLPGNENPSYRIEHCADGFLVFDVSDAKDLLFQCSHGQLVERLSKLAGQRLTANEEGAA